MQKEYNKVKKSEVQTEFTATTTVKWDEKDTLALPPGTVVLGYEEYKVEEFPLDYPPLPHWSFTLCGGLGST